jgi:hypothetical protein
MTRRTLLASLAAIPVMLGLIPAKREAPKIVWQYFQHGHGLFHAEAFVGLKRIGEVVASAWNPVGLTIVAHRVRTAEVKAFRSTAEAKVWVEQNA